MKLLTLFFALAGFYCGAQNLTLKEKQAIAELDFSWSEKRIFDNYGTAVKIELNKSSFAGDMDAILYADSRGAQIAANAIARVCDNKLGKDALREKKVSTVILVNDKADAPKVKIDKGVMTLTIGFSGDNYFSEADLREAIENLL
jgi:hypothetical protein